MDTERAERNRTICLSAEEEQDYLARCIQITEPQRLQMVENKTIYDDFFTAVHHLPRGCVDLLIADPPYNLTKSFGGTVFTKKKETQYEAYTRSWIEAVLQLLKDDATVYVCCDWASSLTIGRVLQEYFHIRNRITWQREKGRGAAANWKNGMEDIWFATKSAKYTFNLDAVKIRKKVIAPYRVDGKPKDWTESAEGNYRDTCPSNFWDDITIPFWSMPENTEHPTQKSEKLIAKLMLASSNPDDFIFDPFLGSGTTSVVAKKLGRRYCGIEQNARYCAICEKRLELAQTDPTIQGYTDGVFWARNSHSEQKSKKKAAE